MATSNEHEYEMSYKGNNPLLKTYVPGNNVFSPTFKERRTFNDSLDALYQLTMQNGGRLDEEQVWEYLSSIYDSAGYTDYETMYNEWYNQNATTLFSPEAFANYRQNEATSAINNLRNAFNFQPIENQLNEQGLNADYARQLAALNEASQIQYNTSMNELARAENEMYRSIGLSQMQYERDIAKRRQQALKSGMSTAQLAAQEQSNILAAQTGATQIAQNYANQRYNTITQFAGSASQNYANVLGNQIGWNQNVAGQNASNLNNYNTGLMNAYAQLYAADRQLDATRISKE